VSFIQRGQCSAILVSHQQFLLMEDTRAPWAERLKVHGQDLFPGMDECSNLQLLLFLV